MNKLSKLLSIVLVGLTVNIASAVEQVWVTSKIKWLYPSADGNIVVTLKSPGDKCQNGSKYFYLSVGKHNVTAEGLKNMYSTLLSSAVAGKSVAINFDAESGNCYINRLYVEY